MGALITIPPGHWLLAESLPPDFILSSETVGLLIAPEQREEFLREKAAFERRLGTALGADGVSN